MNQRPLSEAIASLKGNELFRHYLSKYRWKYAGGLVSLIIVDVLDVCGPLLAALAIDTMSSGLEMRAAQAPSGRLEMFWHGLDVPARTKLLWLAAIYVGTYFIMGVFRYVWRMQFIGSSYYIERDLKTNFFTKLLKLSPGYFGRNSTGDLMSRATNDHEAVRMSMGVGTLILLDAVFYLITVPPLMLYLSWKLTLFVLIPLPLIPFLIVKIGRLIEQRMQRVQEGFSELSRIVQEAFSGIRVVKGYVREGAEETKFEAGNHEYVRANLRLARTQVFMEPVMHYSVNIGLVILIIAGGQQVLAGVLTIGVWVAMQRYISRLSWPMVAIGWAITLTQRGKASAKRILEVVNETPEVIDEGDPAAVAPLSRGRILPEPGEIRFDDKDYKPLQGSIELRGLTFAYGEGRPVLENVSLKIAPGETIALVGRIGSGKSTLVRLLAHLYPVARGQILVDGRDLNDIPLRQLRSSIGFVPQEPFLFSESIGNNIAMGNLEAGILSGGNGSVPDWVRKAAEEARLAAEVDRLPRGYATLLGERGINLSGGQKQRLTLARALVRDPSIVIFDDTLSAVDARTEEAILDHLLSYARRRTAILISHRFTATQRADRIVVLDRGRLVEEGKHDELLAKGGIYAELYERQQLEAALEAEAEGRGREAQP